MSRKRPYFGPSDAQSNAEALYRRSSPYSEASRVSFQVRWGPSSHEPKTIRQMTRDVRREYADGIPTRLHDHDVGDTDLSGAPRYSGAFAQRLYGSTTAVDTGDPGYTRPEDGDRPVIVGYLVRAFDAALEKTTITDEHRIVWRTALGSDPVEAVESMGVPSWCSGIVAYDVLRRFLGRLSAVKLDLAKRDDVA